MADVWLTCLQCGASFRPGVHIGPNNEGVTFHDVVSQCAACKSIVRIPNVRYSTDSEGNLYGEFLRTAYSIVAREDVRPEDRQVLRDIVREAITEAQAGSEEPDIIIDLIRRRAPVFEPLAQLFASKAFQGLTSVLSLLLALLLMMRDQPEPSAAARDAVVRDTIQQASPSEGERPTDDRPHPTIPPEVHRPRRTKSPPPRRPPGPPRHYVSVGRNDPCPCGSGKKFKKCHGSPTRSTQA